MYREKDECDLRNEILSLKRQLNNAKNENCLLKVKVRKLQDEIGKKNKHIEVLLNPKKSSTFRKVMSENGATVVINSLERNLQLQKVLDERNAQIKKLQGDLETIRVYAAKKLPTRNPKSITADTEKIKISIPPVKTLTFKEDILRIQKSNSLTASLEGNCAYKMITKNQDADNNQTSYCLRNSGSPESDLDRNELFCETPHKEIQQLHKYVIDVLSEVDTLKETIAQLMRERKKPDEQYLLEKNECQQLQMCTGAKNKITKRKSANSNKKSNTINKSPRKLRMKKRTKRTSQERDSFLTSCIDAVETQIQKESSCVDTESESNDYS